MGILFWLLLLEFSSQTMIPTRDMLCTGSTACMLSYVQLCDPMGTYI